MDFNLLGNYGKSGLKFTPSFECDLYRQFIREQRCIITGEYGVDPHHVIFRSRGNQCSDLLLIPLRRDKHDELTNNVYGDQDAFFAHYGFTQKDINEIILALLEKFIDWLVKKLYTHSLEMDRNCPSSEEPF